MLNKLAHRLIDSIRQSMNLKKSLKKRPVLVAKNGPKNQESLPQNFLGQLDFRNMQFLSSIEIKSFPSNTFYSNI
jgi:hypothetical protein